MACPCCQQETCVSPRCCECFAALGNRYPRFINVTVAGSCVITDPFILSFCGGGVTYNFNESLTLSRVGTDYSPDCPAFRFDGGHLCTPLPEGCCEVSGIGINVSFWFWGTSAYANLGEFSVSVRHPSICSACGLGTSMYGVANWVYTGCENAISQAGTIAINPVGRFIGGSGSATVTGFQY